MHRAIVTAFGVTLLMVCASSAASADPLALATRSVTPSSSVWLPKMVDVAAQRDGRHLVVWYDSDLVFGAVFAADGTPIGGTRSLSPFSRASHAWRPRAAPLPDGRFVVGWVDEADEVTPQLWLRLVGADGAPLGSPALVGPAPPWIVYTQYRADTPALVADEAGIVVVDWMAGSKLRRFRVAGDELQPSSLPGAVGTQGPQYSELETLARLPDGFALAYAGYANSKDVLAVAVFDRDGRQRNATVYRDLLTPAGFAYPAGITAIRIDADESGRFVVVWHEQREYWQQTGRRPDQSEVVHITDRLRGQRFASDGTPVGDVLELVQGPADVADRSRQVELGDVALRSDGTWLLSWSLARFEMICGGDYPYFYGCGRRDYEGDVHARVLTADGIPLAQTLVVAGAPSRNASGAAATDVGWILTHVDPDRGAVDEARASLSTCGGAAGALCLGNRFRLRVEWRTATGAGDGVPLSVSADTGAFWFFSPTNVELVAKVLDGTGVNGKHWVFFASMTDVEFDLVVTDTATGVERRYHNPHDTMASHADTTAFGSATVGGATQTLVSTSVATQGSTPGSKLGTTLGEATSTSAAAPTVTEGATTACPPAALCLADGRFSVTARWRAAGSEGAATPIAWTGKTGTFWFFSPSNAELAVKVLDGRAVNGHVWVFYASLSDVDFDVEVLDTTTGQRRTYHNPKGTMASRADVEAF